MSETEQNKTEEPTQFKLKRAREKGNVAKGMDLAFFGTLAGLGIYSLVLGPQMFQRLAQMMRTTFLTAIQNASVPQQAPATIAQVYLPAVQSVGLLGGTVFISVLLMQILQIRGFIFTTHPLKPDFNRMNPAKGLKRIFSARTLKEALKNTFKMSVYLACTYLMVIYCLGLYAPTMVDASQVINAMQGSGLRLLFMFTLLSLIFAAIDQVIVQKEYLKQMRMSRSELTRENKDREGEPRLKQKRKQLHAEFVQQTQAIGNLAGSDVLIVNPQHYAVALYYNSKTMTAPQMTTKGRNLFAVNLKKQAFQLGIPVIENPPLARKLFRSSGAGKEISAELYQDVADVYLKLYRLQKHRR